MTRADDGFTLTETLMALLVVSLALAGILTATSMVARSNANSARHLADDREIDGLVKKLRLLVPDNAPANHVVGNVSSVAVDCGASRCRFSLPDGRYSLAYVGQGLVHKSWPSATMADGNEARLEALILQDEDKKTVGVVKLSVEQSISCQFDMISRTCREATPREGKGDR